MSTRGPRHYRSIEEFEREEIAPHKKLGWSLDDLYSDTTYKGIEDDSFDDARELDFDF